MVFGTSPPPARVPIHLGVFLKAAVPGQVKTRLGADLGHDVACELYRSFVADTLEWVLDAPHIRPVVFFSPGDARAECERLVPGTHFRSVPASRSRASPAVEFVPQVDGSLGRKMSAAFDHLFSRGAEKAALIGTDCPLLDRRIVDDARRGLADHDLVLGPANDGGYYLIGMTSPQPRLFQRMPWSTDRVLRLTLARANRLGLTASSLPPLIDVDDIDDLARLESELFDAWYATHAGRRGDFPRRTFQALFWGNPGVCPRNSAVARRAKRPGGEEP